MQLLFRDRCFVIYKPDQFDITLNAGYVITMYLTGLKLCIEY